MMMPISGRLTRVPRIAVFAAAAAVVFIASPDQATAQEAQIPGALAGLGSPPNPKVPVHWDRYYDHAAIGEIGRRLAAAWPQRCRFGSIGKSHEGRDLWLITVTNFDSGDEREKPAMYVDGNIHSNEVQGAEMALYTAWWLCEMADRVPFIDSLLDERVLYVVPTINPDAREHYLKEPNTASSPRTGKVPRDNDGDGLVDEDGYDDLDGNGHITQMRRRNPNGRFRTSPEDPRFMIRVGEDEVGEWELLGLEGIDNDGDGLVNEDAVGGYDPNRNWPWRWAPQYVQGGADAYPGSLPETRAVMDFVISRPNIAGAQSFHNNGGMILRGPGVPQDEYRPQDVRVFDQLGRVGEQILPGYRYMVVWKDLYTVWGGELDWFYGARGILTFSNELWTPFKYFERPVEREQYDSPQYRFDRLLLFGEAFVPWKEYDHPQYGKIEIGGFKKNYGRTEPGFLLQAEAHRNMAFVVYQTHQLPRVKVDSIARRSVGGGLTEVTAIISNTRIAPTHTQQDVENNISRPDWITIEGGDVVAGFIINNTLQDIATEQQHEPARISVANIPGMSTVTVRWLVRGNGPFTVTVDSPKGGVDRKTLR